MISFLLFFKTWYKELALGFVIGTLVYIIFSWWGGNAEISRLKQQLSIYSQQNEQLQTQVSAYEKQSEIIKAKVAEASHERDKMVIVLSKEINKIRNQPIPKECDKAIAYGIQYKGDLQWPEQ
jgi:hypothetical protein